ncbi:hypothetical protein [Actinoplanes sp. NPDC049802]|uniref:hypothetical protein n=1 Tax=Actinoplanes sp. NPDC049802 TaxID=3154742 RepID=UPI0034053249
MKHYTRKAFAVAALAAGALMIAPAAAQAGSPPPGFEIDIDCSETSYQGVASASMKDVNNIGLLNGIQVPIAVNASDILSGNGLGLLGGGLGGYNSKHC